MIALPRENCYNDVKNGEDGTIQGLLQLAGIPFVGSGVLSCAAAMDKEITHILLESAGIRTAPWRTVHREDLRRLPLLARELGEALGYPIFVKPANAGMMNFSPAQRESGYEAAPANGWSGGRTAIIGSSRSGIQ